MDPKTVIKNIEIYAQETFHIATLYMYIHTVIYTCTYYQIIIIQYDFE